MATKAQAKATAKYEKNAYFKALVRFRKEDEDKDNEEENDENNDFYDSTMHKKLNILTFSYLQSVFLIIIFACFMIPVILESNTFVSNNFVSNKFITNKVITSFAGRQRTG